MVAVALATPLCAEDIKITVWAGGSGGVDTCRIDAIAMAADIPEREAAIRGETLDITVAGKRAFASWDDLKQAVTPGAKAGTAPAIVVTSHLDIAAWSRAGHVVPVEDYLDLDAWPLSNV
jgi:inositol-phosphate transport system substrate-binding protein